MDNICLMIKVKDFLMDEDFNFEIKSKIGVIQSTLKKGRAYSIPAYQREIRWDRENVNILLDDLISSKKFLGTILLNKSDELNYEIIDGQQRISVFILILKAIEKRTSKPFTLCNLQNKTYDCLFKVLDLDFDESKILADPNSAQYSASDILEQRERFEAIWKTICLRLDTMNPSGIKKLEDDLLYSEINIILANDPNSKIYVDYYLDLNDKSVKLDNIDILKANLFKINFEMMSEEWANVQRSIKELRTVGLNNYSLPTFYYHYFACSVNKYIDYKLSTLKTDLKFDKSIKINEHNYEAGTNILKSIQDQSYFEKAIEQLKGISNFLKNVYRNDGLTELKSKLKEAGCDNDTILCVFEIISAVIRTDDEVPKMLVMKYFLDVLYQDKINKSDVKVIFYIYVYSVLFTLTSGKKESSKLVRIVLSQDWIEKLKTATIKLWENEKDKINYWKKISLNGKITDTSGQFLPKHILAVMEFGSINSTAVSFNEKKLKEFLMSSTCTAEHFFINKSHKVTFKYGPKSCDAEIVLPSSLTKFISCPVNYLYIESDANGELGNLSIKDKIELLDTKGETAFSSDTSFKYFKKAKEAFEQEGGYPDLLSYTNKSKAQADLRRYYKDKLKKIMDTYIDSIKTI